MFERYFAHTEEIDGSWGPSPRDDRGDPPSAAAARQLVTTLPVGPGIPGMNAGSKLRAVLRERLPDATSGAAWALLEERLRGAAKFWGWCWKSRPPGSPEQLGPVQQALNDVADSLAARFVEWGRRAGSRDAEPEPATTDRATAKALSRRAASLARAVSTTSETGVAAQRLVGLFNAARATLDQAAGRARSRPGSSSACLPRSPRRRLAKRLLRARTEANRCRGSAGADAAELDEQLWALAQKATQILARWRGHPEQHTLLMEATAALQDLAVRSSRDRCSPRTHCSAS